MNSTSGVAATSPSERKSAARPAGNIDESFDELAVSLATQLERAILTGNAQSAAETAREICLAKKLREETLLARNEKNTVAPGEQNVGVQKTPQQRGGPEISFSLDHRTAAIRAAEEVRGAG
ncbi:unnamed protein product [Amoebophrya sp. A120]|nr:unnamed protein product [Amoebophrya sp. A120]|eukprot:GSA120T00012409001.1